MSGDIEDRENIGSGFLCFSLCLILHTTEIPVSETGSSPPYLTRFRPPQHRRCRTSDSYHKDRTSLSAPGSSHICLLCVKDRVIPLPAPEWPLSLHGTLSLSVEALRAPAAGAANRCAFFLPRNDRRRGLFVLIPCIPLFALGLRRRSTRVQLLCAAPPRM